MEKEWRRLEERMTKTISEVIDQRMERILDLLTQSLLQLHYAKV